LAADLLIANEALLARIAVVFDLATADGEQGLANFAADRMDMHKRWSWQLRASLTEEIYAEDMLEPAQAMAPMEEDMAEPMPMRSAFPDFEARRGLLATAERFTADAEVRATTMTDGQVKIAGYAATFMREATGLPFREQIAPGAFSRSLQSAEPVFLLVNHDTDALPLASTGSGTLQLREDSKGLYMEAALDPANPQAAALISATSRGDVSKMSFSFTVNDGGEKREDGLRTLTDLTLYEVSCVTWPAYSDTTVGIRSAEAEPDVALRAKRAQLKQRQINNRTK
jgi:HK97 family phage prohead protease